MALSEDTEHGFKLMHSNCRECTAAMERYVLNHTMMHVHQEDTASGEPRDED